VLWILDRLGRLPRRRVMLRNSTSRAHDDIARGSSPYHLPARRSRRWAGAALVRRGGPGGQYLLGCPAFPGRLGLDQSCPSPPVSCWPEPRGRKETKRPGADELTRGSIRAEISPAQDRGQQARPVAPPQRYQAAQHHPRPSGGELSASSGCPLRRCPSRLSPPVAEGTEPVASAGMPLGDRTDMVYMNTNVTRGAGECVIADVRVW
jgi:hypothetical protein